MPAYVNKLHTSTEINRTCLLIAHIYCANLRLPIGTQAEEDRLLKYKLSGVVDD